MMNPFQIEMGMRNHELVCGKLVAMIAQLRGGGVHKIVKRLAHEKLVSYERGKHRKYSSILILKQMYAWFSI